MVLKGEFFEILCLYEYFVVSFVQRLTTLIKKKSYNGIVLMSQNKLKEEVESET